jgi:hypothetical protein
MRWSYSCSEEGKAVRSWKLMSHPLRVFHYCVGNAESHRFRAHVTPPQADSIAKHKQACESNRLHALRSIA